MAWGCGFLSRSMMSTARASSIRSSLPRFRSPPPPFNSHILHSRRSLFSLPRNAAMEALGCTQSLMPLHSLVADTRLISHISAEARAFRELSQGT